MYNCHYSVWVPFSYRKYLHVLQFHGWVPCGGASKLCEPDLLAPHLPGKMVLIMIMIMRVVGLSGCPCFVIGNDHICSDHSRNDLHQGHL